MLDTWQAFLFAAILMVVIYGFRPVQRWRLRHIPGRSPQWFWGNLLELRKEGAAKTHAKWAREYGPVWKSFGGSQPFVFVDHPDMARQVLLQNTSRPIFPSIWTGRELEFDRASILAARGDKHKSLRSAWQPMFFTGSLQAYSALMNLAADSLIANIEVAVKESRVIDMYRLLGSMTLEVVGTSAFGVHFKAQDLHKTDGTPLTEEQEQSRRLIDAVAAIFSVNVFAFSSYSIFMFFFPFLAPVIRRLAMIFPDKGLLRQKHNRKVIVDTVSGLIEQHRATLANEALRDDGVKSLREDTLEVRKGVAPGSFLDLLMHGKDRTTGEGFTDLALANQAFVMLLAGYETTANTLAFAMYLLAANPEKQQRLCDEVDGFGRGRVPSYDDLEGLTYVEACLKEALRLYPPAPTHIREAGKDTMIGGYRVRKGQWLGVAAYSMHRNPKYWKDPERFLPERFIEGTPEAAERPQHGWVPFGDGVRSCIGMRFALAEAKITLVRIFQRFTFELEPGQVPLQIRNTITISPKDGVFVRATPRTLQREP